MKKTILFLCLCYLVGVTYAQEPFRVMFYNVENLFDCQHDTLKNDYEFLPDAPKGWTQARYHDKLAKIAKVIIATGEENVPDLVGLCEVENDHCLKDLTENSELAAEGFKLFRAGLWKPRTITEESLPILYSITGFSNSAATSRII